MIDILSNCQSHCLGYTLSKQPLHLSLSFMCDIHDSPHHHHLFLPPCLFSSYLQGCGYFITVEVTSLHIIKHFFLQIQYSRLYSLIQIAEFDFFPDNLGANKL